MFLEGIINDVSQFHRTIGASIAAGPRLLAHEQARCREVANALHAIRTLCREAMTNGSDLFARVAMAVEELAEWVEAHERGDLVAAADAWGDRLYVLLGDAVAAGLPASDIFAEVHRSNMTKAAADTAGKARKGSSFDRPQLAAVLRRTEHAYGSGEA